MYIIRAENARKGTNLDRFIIAHLYIFFQLMQQLDTV